MKNKIYLPFVVVIVVFTFGMILLGITSYKSERKVELMEFELLQRDEAIKQHEHDLVDIQNKLIESQENLHIEEERRESLSAKINEMETDLEEANKIISDFKSDEYELIYIGDYKLTHYCSEIYSHICGTGSGLTATGTQVIPGRTIAVDPKVIPYGSEVYIEGYGWRVAEDCGGAVNGKHIDIAVNSHSQALSMGTTTGGVWLLVKRGS